MRSFSSIALILLNSSLCVPAEEKPFPQNRVRDFYQVQAQRYLDYEGPLPAILPAFPGLDGGAWGHWGQNPESDNFDHRLNEIDFGGLVMQVTRAGETTVPKGVNVRCGPFTVLFDPEKLTYAAAWKGDLVVWTPGRYGITTGVVANGELLESWKGCSPWNLPENIATHYQGFHRNGEHIVFVYQIGQALCYDTVRAERGELKRTMSIDGALPPNVAAPVEVDGGETRALATAGSAQWAGRTVTTRGQLGAGGGPYVIDTLTIPYRDANPFKTPMRIGGFDILPDGRIAVCTLMGDVWLVSGVDEDLDEITWRRFASGLNQPLGLTVREGEIHVIGRDQLTRLRDVNSDDEADFYECMTNRFPTGAGDSFAQSLHQDDQGVFYWFIRANGFGVTRYRSGDEVECIATGLRGANGLGVSSDGEIVLAMPQEGDWQPASAIFEVGDGSYHGHPGPRPEYGEQGYQMPLCFIPRGIDNSSGDAVFLPEDPRLGPLSGQIVGTSFGYCQYYLILREEFGEQAQGGVMPLPGEFLSGAHRARFRPHDGHLYIAGTDGWQSYAREDGSLQRVRYTGGPLTLARRVETRENGLLVTFNDAIAPASLEVSRAFCQQWNYVYSGAYGSQEYSVKQPGQPGHDPVAIRGLHLLEDGRTVFVEMPQLHPVMQLHLYLELRTVDGRSIAPGLYYSIFRLGEPFTAFSGYAAIEKDPWNSFPLAGESRVDPRLLSQEALGKIVGDEEQLAAIARRRVNAVAGLQFEPKELQVPAGALVALTLVNEDVSMPHNLVVVTSESLAAVGEGSMQLAAGPEGLEKHYVIEHDGVLALSPMLQPGSSYTIYFRAPAQPGHYPYLCTFPGHWQVTRGVLRVLPRD
ncbi:MAG TPA: plastocyanin/azurin family copper-binding protein [Verrucomicrobiales bacterium]|nr:plastocyanin/azurin family copper-binding protein [Verrucomicrobiales bacterium]